MKETIHRFLWIIIILGVVSLVVGIFTSCKSQTVYIPVETVRTEYNEKLLRDSIYLRDSVLIRMKGDTVWLEKYRYFYKDKLLRDSIFVTDSIQVPYPVKGDTEYVNRLHWWQQLLMLFGAVGIGMIAYRIYSFTRRF